MKTEESLSKGIIKRIVFIAVIVMLLMGVGVFASVTNTETVTIVFSDNTELSIITSKTKVSEILKENNIVLANDEIVSPGFDSDVDASKTIKILKNNGNGLDEEVTEIISSDIISESATVVEKLVVERVKIPYETVRKEVKVKKGDKKESTIVQKGKNGLKEITYKVRYENNVQVSKTKVSEKVIKKPVNKIVRITKKTAVSARSANPRQKSGGSVVSTGNGTWSYSAADFDLLCAITAQESSSSYAGALAVITTACNRAESSVWRSRGRDPLSQYKARGQFCYSIDSHWVRRLNGHYPAHVKRAVRDALNGKRNHKFMSFRSARTGHPGTKIGGNVYFSKMR